MNRNYAYRLYPNRTRARLLERVLDIHRQLYNVALPGHAIGGGEGSAHPTPATNKD